MIELTREVVAYAIIGIVAVIGAPVVLTLSRRHRREKLRRRGIKHYGH